MIYLFMKELLFVASVCSKTRMDGCDNHYDEIGKISPLIELIKTQSKLSFRFQFVPNAQMVLSRSDPSKYGP
jgi:protoheme ferro-lyase